MYVLSKYWYTLNKSSLTRLGDHVVFHVRDTSVDRAVKVYLKDISILYIYPNFITSISMTTTCTTTIPSP